MKVDCGTHGNRAWKGEIVCAQCGRLFKSPALAPKRCVCGAQLLPLGNAAASTTTVSDLYKDKSPGDAIKADFTARVCCSDCFKLHYPRVRQA